METKPAQSRTQEFEQHRSRLFGLAYRMLGSRAEAEDIVQEAYLRWHGADHEALRSPEAWLVTVTTRLSIDRLRAVEAERLAYPGEWLPEPIVDTRPNMRPDELTEMSSDLSMAFMVLLQRLAPEERAAFLLHDVFDCEYDTVASVLRKSPAAIQQVVHRARERVRNERPRFHVSEQQHRALLGRFLSAVQTADENALLSLFAEDATWTADGGGKAKAAVNVMRGNQRIAKFVAGIARKQEPGFSVDIQFVNGQPGLLVRRNGELLGVYSFETDGQRIREVYAVLNPDKLPSVA